MLSCNLKKNIREIISNVETVLLSTDIVSEALKKLQDKHLDPRIAYFYVVDENNRLLGVIPTRKLLLTEGHLQIADVMDSSIVKLYDDQILQDAMKLFSTYSLLAIPVVDKDEKLLGVVDVDMYTEESFDIADARHRSDIFQLIGFSLEDEKRISIRRNYRLRMPWILCSMFGGILCAIISRFNEAVLSKFIVLAMFIPLVLTLSESVSMQTMTHVLQFIRRPRFAIKKAYKQAFKEWQIIGLIGISSGLLVGFLSFFWDDVIMTSVAIGIGIIISVFISGTFALLFPIILHKTKLDPKVASGPVVLMFADVITTSIYLSFASWWLI